MLMCHISCDRALLVQLPKVAITNVWGFHNSLIFLFNHLLVRQWTSKETLARLTFREICCRFGLPLNLTMDNDVRFNNGL